MIDPKVRGLDISDGSGGTPGFIELAWFRLVEICVGCYDYLLPLLIERCMLDFVTGSLEASLLYL